MCKTDELIEKSTKFIGVKLNHASVIMALVTADY